MYVDQQVQSIRRSASLWRSFDEGLPVLLGEVLQEGDHRLQRLRRGLGRDGVVFVEKVFSIPEITSLSDPQ